MKLEVVVGGLERKLVEAVKGQGSRDALIDSLQVKIRQLQQHTDELQVTATHTHTHARTHTLQCDGRGRPLTMGTGCLGHLRVLLYFAQISGSAEGVKRITKTCNLRLIFYYLNVCSAQEK